jgi:outer membrane lipoprotein carrier protein
MLAALPLPLSLSGQQRASPLSSIELAQRVDDHYNKLRSLKTRFREDYDGLGMSRSESGILLLRKPGRMRWDYDTPKGKVFVLDGKFAWFYAPGDSQVQRIAASKLDDLRSPLRMLLGHTKLETEMDNLSLTSGNGALILSGVPHGQQKRIHNLSFTVTQEGSITAILIEEVDGARTSFIFTNEVQNTPIPEAQFQFTPPQGIPVVDALPPV